MGARQIMVEEATVIANPAEWRRPKPREPSGLA
jgi:hypothetical protein